MTWRVRDRATFAALRRSRWRLRRGPVTVTFVPGPPGQPARVAYAIGRRVGGAVVRNRLRRRLRSIVSAAALRPGAYLVGAGPEAAALEFGELQAVVSQALQDVSEAASR